MPKSVRTSNPLHKVAASLRALRQRHEERGRPTGFGFAFADRVDYLNRETWDKVTAGRSLFLRRDVLRVIENHGPENLTSRYAMIFRDDQPVAVMAAQMVSVCGSQLSHEQGAATSRRPQSLLRRALSPATKAASASLRERILVGGNLLSWGFDGIAFGRDENPAVPWPAVAEALYRIRRAERLTGETNFVLVKDVPSQQDGIEALRRPGNLTSRDNRARATRGCRPGSAGKRDRRNGRWLA